MKFHSVFSKLLNNYLEEKYKNRTGDYIKKIGRALTAFDVYSAELQYTSEELTKELVYGWLSRQSCRGSDYRELLHI